MSHFPSKPKKQRKHFYRPFEGPPPAEKPEQEPEEESDLDKQMVIDLRSITRRELNSGLGQMVNE